MKWCSPLLRAELYASRYRLTYWKWLVWGARPELRKDARKEHYSLLFLPSCLLSLPSKRNDKAQIMLAPPVFFIFIVCSVDVYKSLVHCIVLLMKESMVHY